MRTTFGWVLVILGGLCALLGVVIMVLLGPDSRFSTGPHEVDTNGTAVVTAPRVITWTDVRIDVLVEVPVRKPIFVGLGNSVDVRDLVKGTERLEVTDFRTPWSVSARQIEGIPALPGAPTALDWWLADAAGLGGASISTTLPDETVSLAILSVGSTNLSGLKVTLAYGVRGGFAKGVGLLMVGGGALLFGGLLRRDNELWVDDESWPEGDDEGSTDVVYVYVDEHGVERELSAEEAEGYEVVEVIELDVEPPLEQQPGPPAVAPPAAAPAPPPPAGPPPGVMTAAQIAAGGVDSQPSTVDRDQGEAAERVVYVYVDEDGVEHEVGEDELGAFEMLDEEES